MTEDPISFEESEELFWKQVEYEAEKLEVTCDYYIMEFL